MNKTKPTIIVIISGLLIVLLAGCPSATPVKPAQTTSPASEPKASPQKPQETPVKPRFDANGFDANGYDKNGFDQYGFNVDGRDKDGFNRLGFNETGVDRRGFDLTGFYPGGFDSNGFNRNGFDKNGFDQSGFNVDGRDKDGFDRKGFDKTGFDANGRDKDGFDKLGFSTAGFDRKGFDKTGFDVNGFNDKAFNKKGYDKNGFDSSGFNVGGRDKDGFDKLGFNTAGFDRKGFDKNGFDANGFDKQGFDRNGYDKNSLDRNGNKKLLKCSDIYKRGQELGRGANAIVYEVNKADGGCFLSKCAAVVVKETSGTIKTNDSVLSKRASELEVAPGIYGSGICLQGDNKYTYKIEKKLFPATIDFVEAHQDAFKNQIRSMLKKLHDAMITHGDIHLANVLYMGLNSPRFYLTDFDQGLDLTKVPASEVKGHIDFENFAAESMMSGNYYPPGGWPADAPRPKIHQNVLKVWQTQIYKWKQADINNDGEISDLEAKQLSDNLGSATLASVAQELYNLRMRDLKYSEAIGFLLDTDLDGELSSEELSKISSGEPTNVKALYEAFTNDLKQKSKDYAITGSERIVDSAEPYGDVPLQARQILLISGGDVTSSRRFPLKTMKRYQDFAKNMGYRFESHAGNLAGERRVPYWSKVFMLLDKLENPNNRVVVWLDDDGVVLPQSEMIEKFLKLYPKKDLIVAMDEEEYAYLNTGAMIVRNTKDAKDLLREMLRVGAEPRVIAGWDRTLMTHGQATACLHEQQALQELVLGVKIEGEWYKRRPRTLRRDWKSIVEVVPQIDVNTGLNLNLFFDGYRIKQGRLYTDSNIRISLPQGTKPFFVQCAGPNVNKHDCIDRLLESMKS